MDILDSQDGSVQGGLLDDCVELAFLQKSDAFLADADAGDEVIRRIQSRVLYSGDDAGTHDVRGVDVDTHNLVDSLAIIGAGPIGLLTAAVAHSVYGLRDITVVNRSETRRRIAEKLGARALAAIPQGQHFDKVVESAGSPSTLQIALESVRANGTVLVVSVFEENVTIDANILVCSQITLIGCNCYDREDLVTAADLIASGRVDVSPIITDVFPVEEGKTAFEKLCAREKTAAKILLQP